MNVVPAPAPFGECRAGEIQRVRGSAGPGVEIEIVVDLEFLVLPIAAQERAGVEIDNVVRENEGDVILLARAHELVLRPEGKNIIANDILATVVLVESGALAAVN